MSRSTATQTTAQTAAQVIADHLQCIPGDAIAAAVRGEVDVMQLLRDELAGRGLNQQACWVGFPEAARLAAAASPI